MRVLTLYPYSLPACRAQSLVLGRKLEWQTERMVDTVEK